MTDALAKLITDATPEACERLPPVTPMSILINTVRNLTWAMEDWDRLSPGSRRNYIEAGKNVLIRLGAEPRETRP